MGWFSIQDAPELLIGDTPVDLVLQFLDGFRDAYEDGPGRRPTLAELEATMAMAIGQLGSRWIDELDGKQVTRLALKTKKAPKRQPCEPGDVIVIPLPEGDFVFGRVMHIFPKYATVIEVFDAVRSRPAVDDEVLSSNRLGMPLTTAGPVESGEFPVLRRDPDYTLPDVSEMEFLGGPPYAYEIVDFFGKTLRPLGDEDYLSYVYRGTFRTAENVVKDVRAWLGRATT